jgi:hypothetical protein
MLSAEPASGLLAVSKGTGKALQSDRHRGHTSDTRASTTPNEAN